MSQTISDPTQLPLARAFGAELRRLHERMDYPNFASSSLQMIVKFYDGKMTCEVTISTGKSYSDTIQVKGSSLGPVMDEAYRRLNYQDLEQARIDSSMTALPAPPSQELELDDEIPF